MFLEFGIDPPEFLESRLLNPWIASFLQKCLTYCLKNSTLMIYCNMIIGPVLRFVQKAFIGISFRNLVSKVCTYCFFFWNGLDAWKTFGHRILNEVFVTSKIITVETLIISDVTKTESNNNIVLLYIVLKKLTTNAVSHWTQFIFDKPCSYFAFHELCSWKSCIAHATYELFTNLLAD